ncbi:MAG: DUF3280 domain-containing protein [Hyphomicrobiales bacterium]
MRRRFLLAIAATYLALLPAEASSPQKVAVFGFELVDTSLDGEMLGKSAPEQARLNSMAPRVATYLAAHRGYQAVDLTKVAEAAGHANLQNCGDCDIKMAKEAGATLSVTGTVQKVSNLILNVNLYVRDVSTGKMVAAGSADIRSNTDDSWHRGLDWLMKNRIDKQLEAAGK